MTNYIFDFNHISPDLTIEQELELESYYENCHLKCFLYKKAFQHYKKIKYGCRFIGILITAGGIASVIATGGCLRNISCYTRHSYRNINGLQKRPY